MSFDNPGFFEKLRMEVLWNRLGSFRYKQYIQGLQLKGDENILDFGCGGGAASKHIAEALSDSGNLVCIDTSAFWMEKAKKRMKDFSNVEFICERIEDANLPDDYFDSVFIHFVLHDIDENDRQEILNSLAFKLKKNGLIYIREPTKNDHGMSPVEIVEHMKKAGLAELSGMHGEYFRWPHYTGVFRK